MKPGSALTLKVGGLVRVTDEFMPEKNSKHPHAGKTGRVIDITGVRLTGPDWPPRAHVLLDDGTGIAVISLRYLEPIR